MCSGLGVSQPTNLSWQIWLSNGFAHELHGAPHTQNSLLTVAFAPTQLALLMLCSSMLAWQRVQCSQVQQYDGAESTQPYLLLLLLLLLLLQLQLPSLLSFHFPQHLPGQLLICFHLQQAQGTHAATSVEQAWSQFKLGLTKACMQRHRPWVSGDIRGLDALAWPLYSSRCTASEVFDGAPRCTTIWCKEKKHACMCVYETRTGDALVPGAYDAKKPSLHAGMCVPEHAQVRAIMHKQKGCSLCLIIRL